jgi:hypothetical protein
MTRLALQAAEKPRWPETGPDPLAIRPSFAAIRPFCAAEQ